MPDPMIKQLFVTLTAEELQARSDQMAAAERKFIDTDAARKHAMGVYKERLEGTRASILAFLTIVESRQELRPVECLWRARHESQTMELYRVDLHTLVEMRPMTDAERQMSIFDASEEVDCSQCEQTFATFDLYMQHRQDAHPLPVQAPAVPTAEEVTEDDA